MNDREALEHVLEDFVKTFNSIGSKLSLYEVGDSRYIPLLNSQIKVSRAIQNCFSLLQDPKRQILPGKKGRDELAKLMEKAKKADQPQKTNLMTYKTGGHLRKKSLSVMKHMP